MEMTKKQVSSFFDEGKVFQSSVDNKFYFPLQLQLDDLGVFMKSIVDEPVPADGPSPADFEFSVDDPLPPLQPQLDDFEEFMRIIADQPVPDGLSPADFGISLDDILPEGVPCVNNRVNCSIQSQLEKFLVNIAGDPDPSGPSPADFLFSLDDLLPLEAQYNLKYYTARGNDDPQATSSVKTDFPEPNLNEEDFLEMDDLIGSEHTGEYYTARGNDDAQATSSVKTDFPEPNLNEEDFLEMDDLIGSEHTGEYYTARGNDDPQATSSVKTDFPEPNLNEEDFLEMDDLIGSEHTGEYFANQQALENHFDESDLFEDADMFFCDEDSSDQGLDSPHFVNKCENDVANPASNYNLENLQNGNYSSFRHWSHDQQCTILFTPGPAQGTIHPTIPSLPCDDTNHHTVGDQNDGEKHHDDTDSWLSSALWSFVESIPAPPASAAETALVNRSFDRMYSFSRARTNPRISKVAGGVASATSSSSGKCTSGFFWSSVLGLLLAVMWMLAAGMSMRVL